MDLPLEAFDDREGYCRKLGHHVSFAYCRGRHLAESRGRHLAESRGAGAAAGDPPRAALPCARLADCWFQRLPVEAYLRANFSDEELRSMLAPPPPKLQSILEIVARVQAGQADGARGGAPSEADAAS